MSASFKTLCVESPTLNSPEERNLRGAFDREHASTRFHQKGFDFSSFLFDQIKRRRNQEAEVENRPPVANIENGLKNSVKTK